MAVVHQRKTLNIILNGHDAEHFGSILSKLGAAVTKTSLACRPAPTEMTLHPWLLQRARSSCINEVDVVAKLAALATACLKAELEGLVDLMKLLRLDSRRATAKLTLS
jgi:hypothetical protein